MSFFFIIFHILISFWHFNAISSSYFGYQSNHFLRIMHYFRGNPFRYLSKTMPIKSGNWDQLSQAAELPKRFSINPCRSDKCKRIGRVVATLVASFASSTEKFLVRLISVVNAQRGRQGQPCEPNRECLRNPQHGNWQIEFCVSIKVIRLAIVRLSLWFVKSPFSNHLRFVNLIHLCLHLATYILK